LSSASTGLLAARALPMSSAEVATALGVQRAQVADELNRASLERLKVAGETYFVTHDALEAMLGGIERELLAFHTEQPKATGIAALALRDRVDRRIQPKVFDALLEAAAERGLAVVEKGTVRHTKAAVSALAEEEAALAALGPLLASQGLAPATVGELASAAGVADTAVARKALTRLAAEGRVVRLSPELHFDAGAIARARDALVAALQANPDGLTAAGLRDALGVSRKYAIPLLEYFDAQGVTRREGDVRVLRKA
jgi:selenocysteine-specific elongation factor